MAKELHYFGCNCGACYPDYIYTRILQETEKKEKNMLYIATVYSKSDSETMQHACFFGENKVKVIEAAVTLKKQWEMQNNRGPYKIKVGQLIEEVKLQDNYLILPL